MTLATMNWRATRILIILMACSSNSAAGDQPYIRTTLDLMRTVKSGHSEGIRAPDLESLARRRGWQRIDGGGQDSLLFLSFSGDTIIGVARSSDHSYYLVQSGPESSVEQVRYLRHLRHDLGIPVSQVLEPFHVAGDTRPGGIQFFQSGAVVFTPGAHAIGLPLPMLQEFLRSIRKSPGSLDTDEQVTRALFSWPTQPVVRLGTSTLVLSFDNGVLVWGGATKPCSVLRGVTAHAWLTDEKLRGRLGDPVGSTTSALPRDSLDAMVGTVTTFERGAIHEFRINQWERAQIRIDYFPLRGQWDAPFDSVQYNQLRWLSSHNTFDAELDHRRHYHNLGEQLVGGVRSIELDVHPSDAIGIYHSTKGSCCDDLQECLRQLRSWHDTHRGHTPVTVWLDFKGHWNGQFPRPPDLDTLLVRGLGDALYTPNDLAAHSGMIWADEHQSLQQAVSTHGWPPIGRLRGHFLVIVHGSKDVADNYYDFGVTPWLRKAFVAYGIKSTDAHSLETRFRRAIFFDVAIGGYDHGWERSVAAVWQRGWVSRIWRINHESEWTEALRGWGSHLATNRVPTAPRNGPWDPGKFDPCIGYEPYVDFASGRWLKDHSEWPKTPCLEFHTVDGISAYGDGRYVDQ